MSYRTTPTTTTGQTPSELFLARRLRTWIKPDLTDRMNLKNTQAKYHQNKRRAPIRKFNSGESVLVRNYIGKPKWLSGNIIQKIAPLSYTVKVRERMIRKHVDHIRSNHGNVLIEKNRQIDIGIELLDPPDNREQCKPTTRKAYPRRIRRTVQRYGIHPT